MADDAGQARIIKAKDRLITVERSRTGDVHVRFRDSDGRSVTIELNDFQLGSLVAAGGLLGTLDEGRRAYRRVYVDESIHPEHDFIATALVFARYDIEPRVAEALERAGLRPGEDEHKSSARMAGNSRLQDLRERIMNIAGRTKIAVLISAEKERRSLGNEIVSALAHVVTRNGIAVTGLEVLLDEGISHSTALQSEGAPLQGVNFCFDQDSRSVLGIQVADEVAHAVGVILRDELRGSSKMVDIGGEKTGYAEGTEADLAWTLLMRHRYAFFTRPVIEESDAETVDPLTCPMIVPDDEDSIEHAQHPELLGWGVLPTESCPPDVRHAVEQAFAHLWLGCIH